MARSRFSLSLELQKEAAALGIWSSAGSIAIPVKGASIVVGHGTVVTSEEQQLLNCTRHTHARARSLTKRILPHLVRVPGFWRIVHLLIDEMVVVVGGGGR